MPIKDTLFIASQYAAPHALISRLAGRVADSRTPWLKNALIRRFIRRYDVDMSQALREDPTAYESFNDFFTRALKNDARPLDPAPEAVLCPTDGAISQIGPIDGDAIFQAKGHSFTATDLLGGDPVRARAFQGGHFATVYLSPRDYHRVHMPLAGTLRQTVYVPGRLFSVNPLTARRVPNLFARNERLACLFDTALGPMAVVLVGAMIVGSIETVWAGLVTPHAARPVVTDFDVQAPDAVHLDRGAEMGRFKLGSTVVVLLGPQVLRWASRLVHLEPVRMGQNLLHVAG
ncbi:archaetidylserine decarboxylase [Pigmentiphaga soli]|uniref:Phosphatidylserine decarboxylase proenzyme n=1 Tax=Pigmentiphaga soli TaxID=1007095 RepID=A0ABP8GJD4_9BURK